MIGSEDGSSVEPANRSRCNILISKQKGEREEGKKKT
jgi:hypothetical protein